MAHASDPTLRVLHALRIKGFADTDVIAAGAELVVAEAAAELDNLIDKGWARYRQGKRTGWMLLPAGRSEGARLVAEELEVAGERDRVQQAYTEFLALNNDMLAMCTDWQVRIADGEQRMNDHTDEAYDRSVIDRLHEIDAAVQPITIELADALDRYRQYGGRFTTALANVTAGATDWFTKPTIDSYHTVWFELHEDLLATLGIDRVTESAG